jgi:hypothetical protein
MSLSVSRSGDASRHDGPQHAGDHEGVVLLFPMLQNIFAVLVKILFIFFSLNLANISVTWLI